MLDELVLDADLAAIFAATAMEQFANEQLARQAVLGAFQRV
jgi:hypothetical protein